jgi:hypothetical protein
VRVRGSRGKLLTVDMLHVACCYSNPVGLRAVVCLQGQSDIPSCTALVFVVDLSNWMIALRNNRRLRKLYRRTICNLLLDRRLPRGRAVSTLMTVHCCEQNAELRFEASKPLGRLVWDVIRLAVSSAHSHSLQGPRYRSSV